MANLIDFGKTFATNAIELKQKTLEKAKQESISDPIITVTKDNMLRHLLEYTQQCDSLLKLTNSNRKKYEALFKETDQTEYEEALFTYEDNYFSFKETITEYKKGNESKLRKILIPAEIISEIIPVVQVKKQSVKQLLTGKPLMKKDLKKLPEDEKFAVFLGDRFIEVARKVNEGDIVARPEFVFN